MEAAGRRRLRFVDRWKAGRVDFKRVIKMEEIKVAMCMDGKSEQGELLIRVVWY